MAGHSFSLRELMMPRLLRMLCCSVTVLAIAGCHSDSTGPGDGGSPLPPGIGLQLNPFISAGLSSPVFLTQPLDDGRIFVGCEGEELSIAEAVRITGNKPYVFSTDYPHEVDAQTCKHELEELRENTHLSAADKDAILFGNSQRFYQLTLS